MRLFIYTAGYGCPVFEWFDDCIIIGFNKRALWISWGQHAKDAAYRWAVGRIL